MKTLFVVAIWTCGWISAGRAEFAPVSLEAERIAADYDVVIAGAGTGGFGAAVQASRMGAKVLLLDETDYIGGQMNAAAVTSMDEGGTSVRERGIYKEFVGRVEDHYGKLGIDPETAYWYGHIGLEPRVGREILHKMLEEAKVDLVLRAKVTAVSKEGDRVKGAEIEVVTAGGTVRKTVGSRFLVDATEWGDVLPLAGAAYRAGNLTSAGIKPDSKLNEVRIQDITWASVVRKYPDGVPAELKLKQAPPGYTPKIEEMFVKTLTDGDDMGPPGRQRPWTWYKFIGYRGMPDSKLPDERAITRTHLNFNNDYPATVADLENKASRTAMERRAKLKTLQLMWYIQEKLGKKDWGVADDEGYDTPFNREQMDLWIKEQPELEPFREILHRFPVMAYARESRRMIGTYTLKARDIDREKGKPVFFPDSIAVGDYAVDLHGSMTPTYMELDLDRKEDIPDHSNGKWTIGPFAIPYRSLVPEKLDGFLAAEKNFSQSKLGNGATRLQPHTMLIGQAVGATAALCLKHGVQPRQLDAALVQTALMEADDVIFYPPLGDLNAESPEWKAVQVTATHGMLMPVAGKFGAKEPVDGLQFDAIRKALRMPIPANRPLPPTRGQFADFLMSAGAEEKVKVVFKSGEADKAQPLSRSEAARVLADFLRLRGLARTTGGEQTLEWTQVYPASEPAVNADPALKKALRRLLAEGVVTSDDYWLAKARENELCDGKLVMLVMQRAAKKMAPGDERHPAEVLAEKRVITSADYWKTHTKEGATCHGKNVQQLLRGLARWL